MNQTFMLGFTADMQRDDGQPIFAHADREVLDAYRHVQTRWLDEDRPELSPEQLKPFNAVIVGGARVTAKSVSDSSDLLLVARLGVGYDAVDIDACTEADVAVTITIGAVDRPMAEATVTWILALSHNLRIKDQFVRTGQWSTRSHYHGSDIRERVFGAVGLGGIAGTVTALLRSFSMAEPIAYDPYINPKRAADLGIKLVDLDTLMSKADFISIHCPLTEGTRNLIGRDQISRMKASAYLINTARGGIVDEDALFDALKGRRIAGAAIDCFVGEPITEPHRFGSLDNVLLAPHCIGWTHELFRDMAKMASQSVVDLSLGTPPHGLVNPWVLDRPGFEAKWNRIKVNVR